MLKTRIDATKIVALISADRHNSSRLSGESKETRNGGSGGSDFVGADCCVQRAVLADNAGFIEAP